MLCFYSISQAFTYGTRFRAKPHYDKSYKAGLQLSTAVLIPNIGIKTVCGAFRAGPVYEGATSCCSMSCDMVTNRQGCNASARLLQSTLQKMKGSPDTKTEELHLSRSVGICILYTNAFCFFSVFYCMVSHDKKDT